VWYHCFQQLNNKKISAQADFLLVGRQLITMVDCHLYNISDF